MDGGRGGGKEGGTEEGRGWVMWRGRERRELGRGEMGMEGGEREWREGEGMRDG